ncbi:IS256 family transposase [Sphaerochaeta halotolerans]|jgi:transposase-like protein|uniref:Mutator family transposase n=1 Tax=Sphaerochaeta halotolerans TaxID=2293840 RepID=A0A372MEK4_9SPIR|nr:IS256 family transposase [Sphaerochaeta halotolerans]RFU93620.1 IS256 family transposase [Sphaerochaeta halotolerans]
MTKKNKREKDAIDDIVDQLDLNGVTQDELFGADGLVKALTARILNKALEAEMDNHLGYRKHSSAGDLSGNNRNGYSTKKVLTQDQETAIRVPRDRNGSFEPAIVPKHEKRLPIFNEQIIALYSSGMTVRDIQAHLQEIYGVEVSPELISRVTDSILDEVREWRNRPLSPIYPIVYLDALRVNSRESGKNQNKALYIALGINMEGHKEVLGFYLSENEGARFWMGVLTDLKNRGVDDIFIACMDGLTGFPDAVKAVFPQTRIQLCIVHMVRNSTKFVSYKDLKAVCRDLKKIYTASTEEEALLGLDDFGKTWNGKYAMIQKSWESHWDDLNEFFSYPEEIRKVIYTTNAIESLNFSLRKVTKNRAAFPTDESIYKIMYLAIHKASKKWTMPIRNWGVALNQFSIMFEGRVKL